MFKTGHVSFPMHYDLLFSNSYSIEIKKISELDFNFPGFLTKSMQNIIFLCKCSKSGHGYVTIRYIK
jgi:hypothetical protein